MDHYLELHLRPDPEFGAPMLMNALVSKLHRALVELNATDVGVSFPGHSLSPRALGNILRLHGALNRLDQLMASNWLTGMADHIHARGPLKVPDTKQHRKVHRRQVKSGVERLRRRRMKRKDETYEQACHAIPDFVEQKSELPFLTLSSKSTGEVFKLFVHHGRLMDKPETGTFSSYGLSQGATIPWF